MGSDPTERLWSTTRLWSVLAAILASAGLACDAPAPPSADGRPNVLLYVVDTLRRDSLGAYGNPAVETPAVDELAAQGWLFEHAYAPSSWTRPSVASLLTGSDPDAHGAERRSGALSEHSLLLSEHLAAQGYTTGAIVANPNVGSFFGFAQGFDDFVELYARRGAGFVSTTELVTPSDEVTRRATTWIDTAARPFFLFILTVDPHWPYWPPKRFDRYGGDYAGPVRDGEAWAKREDLTSSDRERVRSFYYGEIAFNDESFGTLLRYLRRKGLADDTLIVFTADHGEEFWEHGAHGHGHQLFEESIRVPLIVRAPGRGTGGRRFSEPASLIDVAPTALSLLGMSVPPSMQGRSLVTTARERGENSIYARLDQRGYQSEALISHSWKLLRFGASGSSSLYDLRRDPMERNDLAAREVDRAAALEARLVARAELNARNRVQLGASTQKPMVREEDLPEEARRALQALGYLDEADAGDKP